MATRATRRLARSTCRPRSRRPAWSRAGTSPASASQAMASWASEPRRPARSAPSPIPTAFTAWMLIRPGRGGRRACGPSARGSRARPARRRPAPRPLLPASRPTLAAALTSATMASSASGSKHRTCEASTRARSPRLGPGSDSRLDRARAATTWLRTVDAEAGEQRLGAARRRRHAPPSRAPTPARARRGRRRSRTSASRPGRRGRAGAGSAPSRRARARATSPRPLRPLGVGDLDGHRASRGSGRGGCRRAGSPRPPRSASAGPGRTRAGAGPARPARPPP